MGSAVILALLLLIVIECILIGRKAKDLSGRLICGGVAVWIGFQTFVNICVVTGMITAALCQLRAYIACKSFYWSRTCIKCGASAAEVQNGGFLK